MLDDILSSHNEEDKKEAVHMLANSLEKIHHHGNRAAGIIHQLQEHARAGTAREFFEEEAIQGMRQSHYQRDADVLVKNNLKI